MTWPQPDPYPTVPPTVLDHAREQQARIDATLALHHPDPICAAHHQHQGEYHTCEGPLIYRCASCARTSPTPCRTWRTLTGKETPDA